MHKCEREVMILRPEERKSGRVQKWFWGWILCNTMISSDFHCAVGFPWS